MSREQKELLLKICNVRADKFYLDMKDYWSIEERSIQHKRSEEIKKLETEYIDKYEKLPEFRYINDIFDMQKKLKTELGD